MKTMRVGLTPKLILLMLVVMVLPLLVTSRLILAEVDNATRAEVQERLARSLDAAAIALDDARERLAVRVKDFSNDPVFLALLRDAGHDALRAHVQEFLRREELSRIEIFPGTGPALLVSHMPPRQGEEFSPGLRERGARMELVSQYARDDLLYLECGVGVRVYGQAPAVILARRVVPYNFLDPLRELSNVELTIGIAGKRAITSLMDIDSRRIINGDLPQLASDVIDTGRRGAKAVMLTEEFLGRQYFTLVREVRGLVDGRMLLLASVPQALAGNLHGILAQYLVLLSVVCALLAGVLGLVLASYLIRPIQGLTHMAAGLMQALRAGSPGEQAPERIRAVLDGQTVALAAAANRTDELGILGRSFQEMSERLGRKLFELHTLFKVSGGMNFMNNRDQLLNYILDQTLGALDAERGSIMLYNSELSGLRVELVKARGTEIPIEVDEEGNPKRRLIAPGEGIAGRVFAEGKSIIANEGFGDMRFARTGNDGNMPIETTIKNLLCVPLAVNEQAIGVLNITNKSGENSGFSEDDRSLLEALGTLAAVTIENAKLYELSITDGLTRLFIHRYFQIRLDEEIIRARRYNATVSLILFDIDHFKKFNDTYGHQTGDMVLRKVARVLSDTVRRNVDIPCRYGGEEFAVIAPETGGEDGFNLAERLRKRVEATTVPGPQGEVLKVTISLGVSTCPMHTEDKSTMIRMADQCLYKSKRRGRNCSTLYPGPADVPAEDAGAREH